MSAFDDVFVPVATTLVDLFGVSATYTTTAEGAMDFATGGITVTEVDVGVTATPPAAYQKEDMNDTIRTHDLSSMVAGAQWRALKGTTVHPESGDKLTINSETYTIVSTSPLYSGEEVAVYTLQLRRG